MTEKDYRKLITDIEITASDKEEISNYINDLTNKFIQNVKGFKIKEIQKAGSYASGTLYHNENNIDIVLLISDVLNQSFPLMNQAAVNELYNIILYNYNVTKKNQLTFDQTKNSLQFIDEKFTINLLIRYETPLLYQADFYYEQDVLRISFINMATNDFKLFKNTIQIIKYFKNQNNILISSYICELLLYYGLSTNFVSHTYEAYLKEFNHAIDDLLKGLKIDQDDETYRRLNIQRAQITKKAYMLIDIANPTSNLLSLANDVTIQEFRKLKKCILKQIESK